jgi:hypothetical protein
MMMKSEKSITLKYVPLELAGTVPVKFSIAKNLLSQVLIHGLNVLKYGMSCRYRSFCEVRYTF